ncbi:MAG: fibronectin type III domain-containing protein [Mogibacterium sp.]|nr:fibronectin type III domain-containing protein [Mogibacterium sp.]
MKHAKPINRRKRQKKILNILLVLLVIAIVVAAETIYRDYQARPGFLEKIWIEERGSDYITVAWEKPRNVYRFVVTYNGKVRHVPGVHSSVKLTDLEENTDYKISVRADSRSRQGFETLSESARTKNNQSIEGPKEQMKFANVPVDLKQTAETDISYTSDNKHMVVTDGKVKFTRPGKYLVTAKAEETNDYAEETETIKVTVLDTVNADVDEATPHVFYKLNRKNCELVRTVKGVKEGVTPQSFVHNNGEYVVLYSVSGNKTQRIIKFGKKKTVIKPKANLGHCNGLTIADGRYYMVKGGSPDGVSFNLTSDYKPFRLPNNAAGIAYDESNEMFYTAQHMVIASYDKDLNELNTFNRIHRNYRNYSQDCGAYKGIMMHCVSGSDFQGTNYIDFYDMLNWKYIGSIECQLNEVESLIVDDDGYIQLLCNTKKSEDNIWKTPINMKMLTE